MTHHGINGHIARASHVERPSFDATWGAWMHRSTLHAADVDAQAADASSPSLISATGARALVRASLRCSETAFKSRADARPVTANRHSSPRRGRLDLVGGNLETPADALRLLSSVADDHVPVRPDAPVRVDTFEGEVWNRWPPVREGLLTVTEAATLVAL